MNKLIYSIGTLTLLAILAGLSYLFCCNLEEGLRLLASFGVVTILGICVFCLFLTIMDFIIWIYNG